METTLERPTNIRGFTIVWFGQLVSMLGSRMTNFALAIWAWEITGSATPLSLLLLCAFGPPILLSPIAGAITDRWSRKSVMILADVGAALSTAFVLLLYATGNLEIWQLYVANLVAGVSRAFQGPAFMASITMMVPKEQYGRANGMMSLRFYIPEVVAPLLAGVLLQVISIGLIMVIDLFTFVLAVVTLALVYIPQPEMTAEGKKARGTLWYESIYGFRYILKHRGLLGIQLVFLAVNFADIFQWTLRSPMILGRTDQDAQALGLIISASGIGSVVGALIMSAWGGPKRKIHGVLGSMMLKCMFGVLLMGLGRTVPIWVLAGFLAEFFVPIANSSNSAIWQAKVAPDVQGRVFGARRMVAQFSYVVALTVAGPLADGLFEPAMQPDGALAGIFSGLLGTGPGAGAALILVIWGLLGVGFSLMGYLFPVIRNVEQVIPDHDAAST